MKITLSMRRFCFVQSLFLMVVCVCVAGQELEREQQQTNLSDETNNQTPGDVTMTATRNEKEIPELREKAAIVSTPEILEAYSSIRSEPFYAGSRRISQDGGSDGSCQYTFTVPQGPQCNSHEMNERMSEMQSTMAHFQTQMKSQRRRLDVAESFIRRLRRERIINHDSRSTSSRPSPPPSDYDRTQVDVDSGASSALEDLSIQMQVQLSNLEIQIDDLESKRLKFQLQNLNLTRLLHLKQISVNNLTQENRILQESVTRLQRDFDSARDENIALSDRQRLCMSQKVNLEEARTLLAQRVAQLALENEQLETNAGAFTSEIEKLRLEQRNYQESLANATSRINQSTRTTPQLLPGNQTTNNDITTPICNPEEDEEEEIPNYTHCGRLVSVGDPKTIRESRKRILRKIGVWMKDPLAAEGVDKVWAINLIGVRIKKLYEYTNMTTFRRHMENVVYELPFPIESNGAVVYDGCLYYQRRNSRRIVKYELATRIVRKDRAIKHAGFHGMFAYQWGGFTDIDFAVEETGLWVIYSTPQSKGRIVISKINTTTLRPTRTIQTSILKRKVANSFIICQVLYTVSAFKSSRATINYSFDLNTEELTKMSIPFTNNYRFNSMIDYNPRDRYIYAWDNGRQVRYLASLDESMGEIVNGRITSTNTTMS